MKHLSRTIAAVVIFFLVGCNYCEVTETRIQFTEGNYMAIVRTEYSNISSAERKSPKREKDFRRLIRDWRNDSYLTNKAGDGLYVQERNLVIQDEKLVGRVRGITTNLQKTYKMWTRDGERILLVEGYGWPEVVETNGNILKTEKRLSSSGLKLQRRFIGRSRSLGYPSPFTKISLGW